MKNKPWLLIYVIISFCIIISAVVVSLTAGFNLGTEFGGGTQIEVLVTDSEKSESELIGGAKNALKNTGIPYERIFVEDKVTDTYIVIRTNRKSVDQAALKSALSQNMGVEETAVTDINEISGFITKTSIIWVSTTTALVLIGIFLAGLIRYKLATAVTLTISVLHALILSASILIVTRLPLTLVSFMMIVLFSLLVLFAMVLTFERVLENNKLVHNKDLTGRQLIELSKKETLKTLLFPVCGIALVAFVMIFAFSLGVVFNVLTILVCLVSAIYSYWFVGLALYGFMLTIKEASEKRRLSTDNSPAPKKK